ncbi:YcaQ family DNA glycosylase [Streptosporangiaceae bacterium NEAU-GS5]|nr:YcaQ family DNA glycosylase [Streptosporangiaceae bacterium NEAU-GS5]
MLRRLGAVQLDTISVLARSHELVAYARLGAVGRAAVEQAYWSGGAFEYWCHAACILPVDHWPLYGFRRRAFRERRYRWHEVPPTVDKVLDRVRLDGPISTSDIGGARVNGRASDTTPAGAWWDWSDSKIAIEWLLDIGEVVCVKRVGWRRIYDLAERAIPEHLLADDPTDAECVARLARVAVEALGVATRSDIVDFIRVSGRYFDILDEVLLNGAAGLVPVRVTGWPAPRRAGAPTAWADPAALESDPRGRHRTTLLSPFDSLVWDRPRTERVFRFNHRLEAYVPKDKRVHGYFSMPVLAGGRLVGRVDPAREGDTLVAKHVVFERGSGRVAAAAESIKEALREAATWVGCTKIRIDRVSPADFTPLFDDA